MFSTMAPVGFRTLRPRVDGYRSQTDIPGNNPSVDGVEVQTTVGVRLVGRI